MIKAARLLEGRAAAALGPAMVRVSVINGATTTNYYLFDGEHWVVEYDSRGAIQSNALYGAGDR